MPVLVHNGHPVYESHDQIHYVDEKFLNNSLCPSNMRTEVEKWTDFISIKGDPFAKESQEARLGPCTVALTIPIFASMMQDISLRQPLWGLLHHPNKERPVVFSVLKMLGPLALQVPSTLAMVRGARTRCRAHFENLDRHLSNGRTFVCGESYTLGDVGLTACINRIDNADFGCLYADLKHVSQYWQRLRARPSYEEALKKPELPIMTMGFARIKLWKEQHVWIKDALETDKPPALMAAVMDIMGFRIGLMLLVAVAWLFLCKL